MKKLFKIGLSHIWVDSPLASLHRFLRRGIFGPHEVVVLLYHRVIPREEAAGLFSSSRIVVFTDSFDRQMNLLAADYRVISINDFCDAREKGAALPDKSVIITFDDGWQDNYNYAFPILKKYGLGAAIFITAGYIDGSRMFWQEMIRYLLTEAADRPGILRKIADASGGNLPARSMMKPAGRREKQGSIEEIVSLIKNMEERERHLVLEALEPRFSLIPDRVRQQHSFLTWPQIREMGEGAVDIGSHGLDHRYLPSLGPDEVERELVESRKMIESNTGKGVRHFAYPDGQYDRWIADMVKEAGYRSASTVEKGINGRSDDLFRIKRINIQEKRFADTKGRFSETLFKACLAGLL